MSLKPLTDRSSACGYLWNDRVLYDIGVSLGLDKIKNLEGSRESVILAASCHVMKSAEFPVEVEIVMHEGNTYNIFMLASTRRSDGMRKMPAPKSYKAMRELLGTKLRPRWYGFEEDSY